MSDIVHLSSSGETVARVNDVMLAEETERGFDHRFGFKIGRINFVLEKTLSTEILIKPTNYPIPNSPDWIYGMVNLRGNILPVIDLSNLLRTDYQSSPGDYVLVVDKGRQTLALLVDALPKLLNEPIETNKLSETNWATGEFVTPGVQMQNDIWDQLDIKGLVNSLKSYAQC